MSDPIRLPAALRLASKTPSRELTTVEAIREHYFAGRRLTAAQEEYRQRIVCAHDLLLAGHTDAETRKFLEKRFGLKQTACYTIIRDAKSVFRKETNDREGERYIIVEQLRKKAQQLDEAGEHELYLKCQDQIAKLTGAYDHTSRDNAKLILLPKALIFTTDPAALELQRDIEQAEDEADYEEVP
ncbi:MAG: hypothetical protein ACK4Q5_06065 [Saprospiraceae bacterium]